MAASQFPQGSRSLPERPDLQQLKKQAKELLKGYRVGDSTAVAEVETYEQEPNPAEFALNDSQRVLARAYGFSSWAQLVGRVNTSNAERFWVAAQEGDLQTLKSMVANRPELVMMARSGRGNPLHCAVLSRDVACARFLLANGADPYKGVYPHRESTSPLVLAQERGFDDVVDVIESELQQRRSRVGATRSDTAEVAEAIRKDDQAAIERLLSVNSERMTAVDERGRKPLHHAASVRNRALTARILQFDHELNQSGVDGLKPIDCAVLAADWTQRVETTRAGRSVAELLLEHGANPTPRSAAATGDLAYLQSLNRTNLEACATDGGGGLLTLAVKYGQREVLNYLLETGLDSDERVRLDDAEEELYTRGMPLWHAAFYSEYEMVESSIAAGADVNPAVYASGSPMDQAYGADDEKMKVLLRHHGAFTSIETMGLYRDTEAAREVLAGKTTAYSHPDPVRDGSPAEKMLWAAACGGDPEIVAMCLARIDRAPDDPWWAVILLQPMRTWNHGYHRRHSGFDRSTYTQCLGLLLQHGINPDVTDQRGFTTLHDLAHGSCSGTWNMTEEEELEFGHLLLDAGASMTMRDPLLKSTPLGWACRNGRLGLVDLMIERGAGVDEPDAEAWATPLSWATKMGHEEIATLLCDRGAKA